MGSTVVPSGSSTATAGQAARPGADVRRRSAVRRPDRPRQPHGGGAAAPVVKFLADMVWPGRRSRAVEQGRLGHRHAGSRPGRRGRGRPAHQQAQAGGHHPSPRDPARAPRAGQEPASGLDHGDRQLLRARLQPARWGTGPAHRPRPRLGPRRLRHRPRARSRRGPRLRTAAHGEHERCGAAGLPRLERAQGAAGAAVTDREGAAARQQATP